jgi:hypothetical protein
MGRIDDEIANLRDLPTSMKFVLLAALVLTAFSAATAFLLIFASGFKLDPGLATLTGAIVGLGVVGWQTNRGFGNLIRSQRNQSELDREARLHQAELLQVTKDKEREYEKYLLLASIRAEIAALMHAVSSAGEGSRKMAVLFKALHENKSQNPSKIIKLTSFDAPIYKANIDKLGLLGVSIAADVIRVMSRARAGVETINSDPVPYAVAAAIYAGDYDAMNKWYDDLHHVAVRIIANEGGLPDPGTLLDTKDERYKKLPDVGDLLPQL